MKIAIFTNNYLPNLYGVSTSIESFRHHLEKRGHQIYIFAPYFSGYRDNNSKVIRYPSLDLRYKIRFPLPIPYSRKINHFLDKLNLDIVHSQHPNLLGTAGKYWARKKKIPLVFTWHTLYDHYTNFIPLIPHQWAAQWIIKKAVRYANQADQVIVPTPSIKSIIQRWGVDNSHILALPTGIEEKKFQGATGEKIRKKYQIEPNDLVLLLVSRLTEEKNVEFIFRSLQPLFKKYDHLKFLVVGEGYLKKKLEKKYASNKMKGKIIFTGLVDKKEIKHYYAVGDIFVYASQSETQGLIIAEALYLKLPVVAVQATGISDILANSSAGILTSTRLEEFRQAVKELIGQPEKRKKMGEMGKKLVQEKYTASVCAEKLEKIYKENIENIKK